MQELKHAVTYKKGSDGGVMNYTDPAVDYRNFIKEQ